jgi:uncharacterized membrane protein YdbT with pleckstrin-like domain
MGRYVNKNLIRNERVQYEAKNHWIIFLSARSFCSLFTLPLIDIYSSEFVVTNRRVIMKTGLIARNTLEMNLTKIESVTVDQSIMGRILGFGSITLVGNGSTRERFDGISRPMVFRRNFQELI